MMDIVGTRTLRDLWDDLAVNSGDRTFLIFEDRDEKVVEYSYAEFDAQINKTANLFQDLGFGRGDTVAVHLHNCPELLMCMFGLAKIGAVLVPLHPRNTRTECTDIIARAGVRAVVCESEQLTYYGSESDQISVPHVIVARGGGPKASGVFHFEQERDARPDVLRDPPPVTNADPVGIVFTSGTTSRPKGVVLTHYNLMFSGVYVDWQAAMMPSDRLMTTMPACHINFQLNALMPVLIAGATLVTVEKYSASKFWRQACLYEATIVQGIAMMVRTMLMQPQEPWERNNQVREVLYYLPITDQEKEDFESRFDTRVLNSYGTTETLVGVITDPPHGERRWPSIGKVGPSYGARIADEFGALPADTVGEIQIRGVLGQTLMKEYLDDPESTASLFDSDGWMHTGDLGYVDADGWFYFLDRRTHMIKRAGENISPSEVEAVLTEHPGIVEAAVIGIPDPVYDEAVKAFIVLTNEYAGATSEEIQSYCLKELSEFKVPTVVEFVDSLPKTGSFKIAKGSLK